MSRWKAIAVILAIGIVRLLKPLVTIRFGSLFVSRLGHLSGNTECYLCERDAGINRPKYVFDLWTPVGTPANEQLFKMYARIMPVLRFGTILNQIGMQWSWWRPHMFGDAQWGRDIYNLMEKTPPHLKFTRAEEKRGQQGLRELGIPEGAKWVCIIARDSYFLQDHESKVDYSYHDYRDSDIQKYRAAAMALMERGYYVLRMGKEVAERMRLRAPMFIDYAMSNKRSDFMDVYLGAKCEFCITNSMGFDGIPMVFRRPLCFVNESQFEYLSTWMVNSLAIWKHHVKDGKRMTPAEIISSGAGVFHSAKQYADAGITLIENTPDEIRDAALEMLDISQSDQSWFWDQYTMKAVSPHNGLPLHGARRLRIGAKFLEQYAI